MSAKPGRDIEEAAPEAPEKKQFVDFVSPPKPIKPPAKWKLWMMVFSGVYAADYLLGEADYVRFVQDRLNFSRNSAVLVLLCSIVWVLVYGYLDILKLLEIKIGDTSYGVVPWLKLPRTKWVHEYTNPFVVAIATIVNIFENGFALFNVPPPPKAPPAPVEASHDNDDEEIVFRIENKVRSDKTHEYLKWRDHMNNKCWKRPGLKKVDMMDPVDDVYVMYIHFDTIDHLNEYMTSPVHDRMVRKLQPFLDEPSLLQLRKERILPDALTDMVHGQGNAVPKLMPKKWKVWTITTMGLWFVVMTTGNTMPFYYNAWHITGSHTRFEAFARIFINTFLNTYVGIPFLSMVFGHWMKRKPDEFDTAEPWRTLNDGFTSIWGKLAVVLILYGGAGLVWLLDDVNSDETGQDFIWETTEGQ